MNLDKIIAALRDEIMLQEKFEIQPLSMSVTGVSMNQYEPLKAIIRINFAPKYIMVRSEKA